MEVTEVRDTEYIQSKYSNNFSAQIKYIFRPNMTIRRLTTGEKGQIYRVTIKEIDTFNVM